LVCHPGHVTAGLATCLGTPLLQTHRGAIGAGCGRPAHGYMSRMTDMNLQSLRRVCHRTGGGKRPHAFCYSDGFWYTNLTYIPWRHYTAYQKSTSYVKAFHS